MNKGALIIEKLDLTKLTMQTLAAKNGRLKFSDKPKIFYIIIFLIKILIIIAAPPSFHVQRMDRKKWPKTIPGPM